MFGTFNSNTLGGKLLRLNLDGTVPCDNPFVPTDGGSPLAYAVPDGGWFEPTGYFYWSNLISGGVPPYEPIDPRIWAFGFHSPFHVAFEPHTGDVWLSDENIYDDTYGELDHIERGRHYGFPYWVGGDTPGVQDQMVRMQETAH